MGSQASRDTCEGDIRLWVTRLLSPICSGSPGTEVFRIVSTSPLVFNMTVMRTSGAIVTSPEVPVGGILPLTAVDSIIDDVSTVTPFVLPLPPDIEQPVMQLHDFLTHRTPESRQSSLLCSLLASSSALMLPRKLATFSSSSFSLDRYSPLRGNESPLAGGGGEACCRRRQMTVCFRVWMIQTLPAVVSRFQGQNTLRLCLHVRRSGLCCQPDPLVLPTESVVRISTTLPERSPTSATVKSS